MQPSSLALAAHSRSPLLDRLFRPSGPIFGYHQFLQSNMALALPQYPQLAYAQWEYRLDHNNPALNHARMSQAHQLDCSCTLPGPRLRGENRRLEMVSSNVEHDVVVRARLHPASTPSPLAILQSEP